MATDGHAPHVLDICLAGVGATEILAASVAERARAGDAILLKGDLGSGKTCFARAFIAARAGAPVDVPSPTFTLVQTYDLPGGAVWHFDLYRLERPGDARELDIEEAFADAIALVEWPERLGGFVPPDRLEIAFAFGVGPDERRVRLSGHGRWAGLLPGLPHA